jgi:predicted alpha-1,2-mannosidase
MRFLKRTARIFLLLVLIAIITPLSLWGYYRSIVRQTPGALPTAATPGALSAEVNVFNGTGGVPWVCAYNTPAAQVPWGLVRLGPDTASILTDTPALNASGYYYGDNKIIGFSHTRLVGADAEEGGVFRVFPATDRSAAAARKADRAVRFSHSQEKAFPGYYAVRLPKENILVELTATPRAGIHRYTFAPGDTPHLIVDVTSFLGGRRVEEGVLLLYPDRQGMEGKVRVRGTFSGRYDGLDVYFAAKFSRPFAAYGTWNGDRFDAGSDSAAGSDIGVDIEFAATPENVVELRLALSHVSMANAWENLEAETGSLTFQQTLAAATRAWEERLGKIRITGGTETHRRIFYTALYRTMHMPSVFEDVNGQYRGFDKEVHESEGFTYYTDFSLWDTFRTVHPLYNLIAREAQRDMMVSLVEMAKTGGAFPRWPAGCGYTNCMFGTPADIAVTEAWLKGIRDFDMETAYTKMRQLALEGVPEGVRFGGRNGLQHYLSLGYCPADKMNKSVSATVEYGWADHALSLLAKDLGHTEDAATFAENAQSYRKLWNPETQYLQARNSDGSFSSDFDPDLLSYLDFDGKYTEAYVEGSALQWRWTVPFDPDGLISLFNSREYFVEELEKYFEGSRDDVGGWNPGGYYWHGNEPGIPAVYLFNSAGRPDLTQKWVRWLLETKYADDYVGLDGNDDGGTLSGWYVFSALGFYPIAGTTRYELGAPLFETAEIDLGESVLKVVAENYAPDNIYVESVTLNGVPLEHWSIDHSQIAQGGELRFKMRPST